MTRLSDLVRRPDFQRMLREGRGAAPVMCVYRGGATGDHHSTDDGNGGDSIRLLDQCLDEIARHAGYEIADANVFCSSARTTLTVKLAIPGCPADIAFYYDTCTDRAEYQILHREQVHVTYASQSDLLAAFAEPDRVLDEHFAPAAASAMRAALASLGLEAEAPAGTEMEYETYAFPLRER